MLFRVLLLPAILGLSRNREGGIKEFPKLCDRREVSREALEKPLGQFFLESRLKVARVPLFAGEELSQLRACAIISRDAYRTSVLFGAGKGDRFYK